MNGEHQLADYELASSEEMKNVVLFGQIRNIGGGGNVVSVTPDLVAEASDIVNGKIDSAAIVSPKETETFYVGELVVQDSRLYKVMPGGHLVETSIADELDVVLENDTARQITSKLVASDLRIHIHGDRKYLYTGSRPVSGGGIEYTFSSYSGGMIHVATATVIANDVEWTYSSKYVLLSDSAISDLPGDASLSKVVVKDGSNINTVPTVSLFDSMDVVLSASEYEALEEKDPNRKYFIYEDDAE